MYEECGRTGMSSADYDAGMDDTLDAQEISVNGKSRLTTALLKEIQKREGDPKRWARRLEAARPVVNRRDVTGPILEGERCADLQDPREEDPARTQIRRT